MIGWVRYSALVLLALVCASGNCFGIRKPKIATRLYPDSTIFTMHLMKGSKPAVGKTFKVKIHVDVRTDWFIFSSKEPDGEGFDPLRIKIPDSLSDIFELSNLEEHSNSKSWFDSLFVSKCIANFEPFDLTVTIRVKKNVPFHTFFYLLATYQGVSQKKKQCLPPMTFEIPMAFLGQKPILLKIAGGTKMRQKHLPIMKPAT